MEHFPLSDPILGSYAKIKKIANKSKFQADDPWVEKLADAAMKDPEYVAMIADLENGTELKEIDKNSELAKIQDH